jgi:hypothetical protein
MTRTEALKIFTFYLDGLNREVDQVAETEKAARAALWSGLSDDEQDSVRSIECIDEA